MVLRTVRDLTDRKTVRSFEPVFIVGAARSGTTLLFRTLQRHPTFHCRELNLAESNILRWVVDAHLLSARPSALIRFLLDDEETFDQFLREIRPARIVARFLARLGHLNRRLPGQNLFVYVYSLRRRAVRKYLLAAHKTRGCERLVEKTPTNINSIRLLVSTFPRAKFLYLVRDPLDVYHSWKVRSESDPDFLELPNPRDFATAWLRDYRVAADWQDKLPSQFRVVDYKEFTEKSDTVWPDLCTFLGVEVTAAPRRKPGQTVEDKGAYGPPMANSGHGVSQLDERLVRIIRSNTGNR